METVRELESRIEDVRKQRLDLDITRGKPAPEQLADPPVVLNRQYTLSCHASIVLQRPLEPR